jgi:hypothetical protein
MLRKLQVTLKNCSRTENIDLNDILINVMRFEANHDFSKVELEDKYFQVARQTVTVKISVAEVLCCIPVAIVSLNLYEYETHVGQVQIVM